MSDITARPVRTRIAPSPTGNCHVGTARNALYNLLLAHQRGGAFVLRIDDTDARRSMQQSEQGVFEGLRWRHQKDRRAVVWLIFAYSIGTWACYAWHLLWAASVSP